jgi:hypothetical protein
MTKQSRHLTRREREILHAIFALNNRCGSAIVTIARLLPPEARLSEITMSEFARVLSMVLGRRVIGDKFGSSKTPSQVLAPKSRAAHLFNPILRRRSATSDALEAVRGDVHAS